MAGTAFSLRCGVVSENAPKFPILMFAVLCRRIAAHQHALWGRSSRYGINPLHQSHSWLPCRQKAFYEVVKLPINLQCAFYLWWCAHDSVGLCIALPLHGPFWRYNALSVLALLCARAIDDSMFVSISPSSVAGESCEASPWTRAISSPMLVGGKSVMGSREGDECQEEDDR